MKIIINQPRASYFVGGAEMISFDHAINMLKLNNEVYFFTKSSLEKDSKSKSKNNKVFIIISIVEALVIVGLIASKFIKPKKKEEKPIEKTEEEKNTLPEETKEEETPIDFPSSQL